MADSFEFVEEVRPRLVDVIGGEDFAPGPSTANTAQVIGERPGTLRSLPEWMPYCRRRC
ncbi:MAG: hypothetical protein U5O16_40225 [Rhodococcus sp. (in: high G+C Gram-positive bacteria)]|uniref:hypothetical protein n=1 Tax=Rhodococcus sp. TaxID=1831 RepID=UPI002ADB6C17|nr:hypothetical protein [Rhodococcus sp. (in: high G+C Gram-positive bacteria)]